MRRLKQLTPQEVFFIGGETRTIYQHTAGLILLDASKQPGFGFQQFRQHIVERIRHIPQFRWKLHEVPLGLDLPYWVEDDTFDFNRHIRQIAVPSPGDDKALAELVCYLYSRHLDRNRPLWESWFIEGLAGGRYALLQKMHHCMMDGEGATQLGAAVADFEANPAPRKIDPALAQALPGEVPETWRQYLNAARRFSQLPLKASSEIVDVISTGIRERLQHPPVSAPATCLNDDIGSRRGFVFGSLSLADVKAVKNHFGVTINDVVLAIVGGSLRNYLLRRGALPDESLRSHIAVSLRTEGDDEFSNRITNTTVTVATDLDDPLARLQAIAADSEVAKQRAHTGGKGLFDRLQLLPPVLVNALMQVVPGDRVPQFGGANLLVSNVRGSPLPMYIGGARVEAIYPMSIMTPGSGLNVTCISYVDTIDCGVTFDPELFPYPWSFIADLEKTLAEYVKLMRKPRRNARAQKPKRKAVRRKTVQRRKSSRRSNG